MADRPLTQRELLSMWERGEGQRPSRRALALLPAAAGGDAASLPVGRRDAELLALREQLFGSAFTGVTSCPSCGEELELEFDAAEVRRDPPADAEPVVRAHGYEVELRLPTSADLAAIERTGDLAEARARLLERCIVRASKDGVALAADELPAGVVEAVAERLSALDPQADVAIDVDCPSCRHAWREPFDVVTFFWSEISVLARRLLGEVHELASAYGWSERDILELSPARRNAYLEMVR